MTKIGEEAVDEPRVAVVADVRDGTALSAAVATAEERFGGLDAAVAGGGLSPAGAMVKGLAADLRGTGVTATAVSPGSTRTPMLDATAALYDLDDVDTFAAHHLTERLLDPDEVAAVIAWLCSSDASAVTGSVIRADGGFTG